MTRLARRREPARRGIRSPRRRLGTFTGGRERCRTVIPAKSRNPPPRCNTEKAFTPKRLERPSELLADYGALPTWEKIKDQPIRPDNKVTFAGCGEYHDYAS